jgi:hypothetical protein
MNLSGRRFGAVFLGVGVVAGMSGASGETTAEFHVACSATASIDKALATAICADFTSAAQSLSGTVIEAAAPLALGPGLEIRVDAASDHHLEVTPTWVDAQGGRVTQGPVGMRIVDARMTAKGRNGFFSRLISNRPE